MKQYHPMARTEYKRGEILGNHPLFLQDSVLTIAEATYQFFFWANSYNEKIIHAWIDIYEDGKKIDTIDYYKDRRACEYADEQIAKEEAEWKAKREGAKFSSWFDEINRSETKYHEKKIRGVANQATP